MSKRGDPKPYKHSVIVDLKHYPSEIKVHPDLTWEQIKAVPGVNIAYSLGGDAVGITLSPRYDRDEVIAAIAALAERISN